MLAAEAAQALLGPLCAARPPAPKLATAAARLRRGASRRHLGRFRPARKPSRRPRGWLARSRGLGGWPSSSLGWHSIRAPAHLLAGEQIKAD